MNKTVHFYILMCLIVSQLFSEHAGAGYPFAKPTVQESIRIIEDTSAKIQKLCSKIVSLEGNYTAEQIHLSSTNGFSINQRSGCLFPLIAKRVLSEISFFQNELLLDTYPIGQKS